MNTALKLTAIAMNIGLLSVALINFLVAPFWMSAMILFSGFIISVIAMDIIESLKKIKAFTMIELIAVITIMAILLTMVVSGLSIDKTQKDVKIIGGMIQLYQAKANTLLDGETYSIYIGEKLTVKDNAGNIIEDEELTAPIEFLDGPTNKTFSYNHRGEVVDLSEVLRFKVGEYKVKVNNFTGKFSYYDELAEY